MSAPELVTEPLGGSALSQAARAGQLPQWYRAAPGSAAGWREYAGDVARSVDRDWYVRLEPAIHSSGPAAERLRRVAAANGVVVTTGQQPGLFGGPLYTFLKALTARALADVLETEHGIAAAPLFWAATDDADFAEASIVSIVT